MTISLLFRIAMAFILSVFMAIGGFFSGGTKKEVCMIAHRGYSSKYLENTQDAFTGAAKHGSGGAETDVRVTSDGVYVTSHNSSVVLKDGTQLEVADHTYAELTSQPLRNNKTLNDVYLCTFEQYLEIMKENNLICFIELKGEFDENQVKEIFTLASEVYSLDKCILQSFNFDNLIRAHEMFPDLRIMLTYGMDDEGYERCFEYGFSIDCDYKAITEEMIEEFHSRGLEVALWTSNDPFSLAYCKSLGVDYIESDVYGG